MSEMSIFTDEREAPDEDLELDDLEASLDEGVEVPATTPPPLGRSYARDFRRGGFVPHGAGPLQTTGLDTLRGLIEKTLLTMRGAHPVYDDEVGVDDPYELIGEPLATVAVGDLKDMVTEALLVLPRVEGVANFRLASDPDDEYLLVSFDVQVTGVEGGIEMTDVRLGA